MSHPAALKTAKKVSAFALVLMSLALSACGPSEPSSSSSEGGNSSQGTNEYYNPDNFVTPAKEVTTTKLVTYDGPNLMESSKKVSVKANGRQLFVYETLVNHAREFTWAAPTTYTQAVLFDFEGKVHLDITITDQTIESAVLRPLVYGITPSFTSNTISFDLTASGNYVVEYNNDPTTAIQIFANPIEEDPITEEEAAKDPNTIYVGPGIYDAGAFPIKSNTTIYLAGGAYVYGQFSAEGVDNVTIKGRGIVSGSIYTRKSSADYTIPVVMRRVTNLTIQDVAFFDPAGWTLHLWKCEDVKIKNVKIITARSNGDGISVQSCKNVEVSGGYVRTWDDALVVKNSDMGITSNVNIHDVVVWSDLAQAMEVGYETYGPTMDGITFQDITVVHAMHKAVISLHNCDQAKITNVTYKNITVEDCQTLGDNREDRENDFLIDFTIAYNEEWTKSGEKRGSVDGINIENVKVYDKAPSVVARMRGEEADSSIKNVSIKGLEIGGKQIENAEQLGLTTNEFVSGLTFAKESRVLGAHIHLPYLLHLADQNVAHEAKPNIEQGGLIVPEFARYAGDAPFIGVKSSNEGASSSSHGAGTKATTPADDGSGPFLAEGSSAANAFDGNPKTFYETGAWKNEDNEFGALTLDFQQNTNVGVVRVYGDPSNEYSLVYSIQVWARKKKSDGTMNPNYTRLVTTKEYEMTPANGNLIDINLPTAEFAGIQLRFVRGSSLRSPSSYKVSEVEFYPPSLTYMKSIVDSTEHNDVYVVGNLVDGDPTGTSYYESKSLPAHIVIDLGDVYTLSKLVLSLPPILTWSARTQNIEISVSAENVAYSGKTSFAVAKAAEDCTFDPQQGNRVILDMGSSRCRFLKVVINSNDAAGGYGGQLSEISAYGVK